MTPGLGLVWALTLPPAASGQSAWLPSDCQPVEPDSVRAVRFAPRFSFHETERYFPTVPFFTAFFQEEGRGFGEARSYRRPSLPTDLEALAPRGADPTRASWSRLTASYDRMITDWLRYGAGSPPAVAVFYQVDADVDEGALWDFLESDEQAWDRNRMSDFRRRMEYALRDHRSLPDTVDVHIEFKVVKYFFYYLNDAGVRGHPEDIEFAFVFMPADRMLSCRMYVMVGAGHEDRQPNNVLVELRDPEISGALGTGLVVELGGHASAPDAAPFDGNFVLGEDINWGLENVWGTRDLLAVSGSGAVGTYHPELTLPRRDPRFRLGLTRGYTLIPVEELHSLETALEDNAMDRALTAFRRLGRRLGVGEGPDTLGRAHFERLRSWARPLEGGDKGHRFWDHDYAKWPPHRIFKAHVYRGFSWRRAPIASVEHNAYLGMDVRAGLRFPLPKLWGLAIPGIGELSLGLNGSGTSVRALVDTSMADWVSTFVWLAYDERWHALADDGRRSRWWLAAGVDGLLWLPHGRKGAVLGGLRFRTGPMVDLGQLRDGIRRLGWTAGFTVR